MHKFAFGSLGLTPYEYYTMSPYEFFATCEGFFDREDRQSNLIRMQSLVFAKVMGANVHRAEDLWSLFSDKATKINQVQIESLTQEEYENIKKLHGIN